MNKEKQKTPLTIFDKILLGALKCSNGEIGKPFTFEELVIDTWQLDKNTFGLRGFEEKYPDSHKLHPNVFGGSAIVARGHLRMEDKGVLSLTEMGMAHTLSLQSDNVNSLQKFPRQLQATILRILEQDAFKKWLTCSECPKNFRGAGRFWGISPGTPPKAVRERVLGTEKTLEETLNLMDRLKLECITEDALRGKPLFERKDVERCLEFHKELKSKFKKELEILDPDSKY